MEEKLVKITRKTYKNRNNGSGDNNSQEHENENHLVIPDLWQIYNSLKYLCYITYEVKYNIYLY